MLPKLMLSLSYLLLIIGIIICFIVVVFALVIERELIGAIIFFAYLIAFVFVGMSIARPTKFLFFVSMIWMTAVEIYFLKFLINAGLSNSANIMTLSLLVAAPAQIMMTLTISFMEIDKKGNC